MARNKNMYLEELSLAQYSKSKYIKNKGQYINKQYDGLYLKDIVCTVDGLVYGVCDCECGEKDIVTGIHNLISGRTKRCACGRGVGKLGNTKYDNNEYIDKVYGHMKVIKAYNSLGDGVYIVGM